MIPLCVPNLAGREREYLNDCVTSTFVSTVGPFVTRFEEDLAKATSANYAVATCSGTSGLHAALLTVGVGRDDLVVAPAFTFIATANAIAHTGAMPWLFDVDETSWTIDVTRLASALARETERREGRLIHKPTGRRISAIVPVFTLGTPADMDALRELARAYQLPLVVDAAAGIGARYKGRELGQLGADMTMLSFNGNKTITCGGGGGLITNDRALADLAKHITTTARVSTDYVHDRVGYNYRMTNLEAAVGCAQLEQLEGFLSRKREIAATYADAFRSIDEIAQFPVPDDRQSVYWFSGFVFEPEEGIDRAKRLIAYLNKAQIGARSFWRPIHMQAPYVEAPCEAQPVTERIWNRIVTLPCSTHLSQAEQAWVIENVKKWFAHGG